MSFVSRMLAQIGLVERRRDGRVPVRGLEVFSGVGAEQKKLQVRDISPTGLFVVSGELLEPGGDAVLTLERQRSCRQSGSQVQLHARVVRRSEEGVGLTFVCEEGENSLWLQQMGTAATLVARDDTVGRFRVAKALFFLAHVSPSVPEDIAELMTHSLDHERRERLVEMVLGAEERLEQWAQQLRSEVSPILLRVILQEGSKAEDAVILAAWVQLLTMACLTGSDDEETLQFADVLTKLLPVDLAIFAAACERTLGVVRSASMELYCSAEEMREIAHTPNLVAIEQHLNYLYELGLLGRTVKPLKGEQIERANMTATAFGLQLYARCCEPSESLSVAACG